MKTTASLTLTALLLAVALLRCPSLTAAEPFAFDRAPGRLPKNVVPVDYDIAIAPNVAAHTFTGTESVTLTFRQPTATIVFNTLNLTLRDVRLDGQPVQHTASDNDRQLSTLILAHKAAAGTHRLTLSYSGVIEQRPQGLFAQPYRNSKGGEDVLLATQMESTDARRMFPCWDEPAFRATFRLSATIPMAWAAVGNMPIERRTIHGQQAVVHFQRSPRMPSYLVEFSAGDLREISAAGPRVRFGVWAVSGREQQGAQALADAQHILADYDDYFGYPYPLPKLDSIAIPGGFAGAMENWGAITYNDQALLLSPASSLADAQEVFAIEAHEMAHQWNGDLVTMGWWDDLWLNESFASWIGARETDQRHPEWKWWEREDASREQAMEADARSGSHAIQVHVTDELQAANAFDPTITYNKGEAVLRMLEAYLGPDTFRDGIRRYIKARAFSNATTADLWNGLSAASDQDVGVLAAGWTEQAGFPLVSVTARCGADGARSLTLRQQRFFLSAPPASGAAARWRVPLQIRTGAQGVQRPLLLTQDGQTVSAGSCREPLSLNAGAVGYYRVQYDAATLATNTRDFATLPDADRIALLDDQWALVQSRQAALPAYLALAENMGTDLDRRAWEQIINALQVIEFDARGSAGHDAFASYARALLTPAARRLGWDPATNEALDTQELRRQMLGALGNWGDPQVIAEARRRFAAFLKDHAAIRADDQEMVLDIVGHYADPETFEQLHALAKASQDDSEQRRYYLALAATRNPVLAREAASIALSPELPPQDTSLRREMIGAMRHEHPQLAWQTFSPNAAMLLSSSGNLAPLFMAVNVPQAYWNSLPPEQMEAWVRAHVPAGMNEFIEKGMEGARFRYAQKQQLVPAAAAYLATRPNS